MLQFIELRDRRGRCVVVNLDHVIKIDGDGKLSCTITFSDGSSASFEHEFRALADSLTRDTADDPT